MKHTDTTTITIPTTFVKERLDKALALLLPDLSRARVRQLIEGGCVSLQGKTIEDAKYRVKPDQVFAVKIPKAEPSQMQPADIPLDIVFEDEHMLVINKPAGLTVHPGAGNHQDTLANALLAHCGDSLSGIGGVERPGIVHRIDKDTSGLLVVAKHDVAHRHLSEQLAARTLKRQYVAICWGVPNVREGVIEANIGRSQRDRKKMAVVKEGGKTATTHYKVTRRFGELASLVECELETGRTHQIRVHMTHLGHPLIGDVTYGSSHAKFLRQCDGALHDFIKEGFKRQALHAARLRLIHPKTEESMAFEAPLPAELSQLVELLGSQ